MLISQNEARRLILKCFQHEIGITIYAELNQRPQMRPYFMCINRKNQTTNIRH
jgi:hypothetical protein